MILNNTLVVGRVTATPEIRQAGNSTVANFSVAFSPRPYYDAHGVLRESETVFVPCVRWGPAAAELAKRLTKGTPVAVEGKGVTDKWQDKATGKNRTATKLEVTRLQKSGISAGDYCRIQAVGNLTRDPEKKTTAGGETMAIFCVAVNDFPYTDKTTNEKVEKDPAFYDCVCFGSDADNLLKFKKAGDTVLIEGTFYTNTWTPEGHEKPIHQLRVKIIPGGVHFLTRQSQTDARRAQQDGQAASEDAPQTNRPAAAPRGRRNESADRSPAPVGAKNENVDEDVPW